MNTTRHGNAGLARPWMPAIALTLMVAVTLGGCGTNEETQRAADALAYHAEPVAEPAAPGSAVTAEAGAEPMADGIATGETDGSGSEATVTAPTGHPQPASHTTPATSEPMSYADAEALYHQRRYNEAADAFGAFAERRPDHAWGHYMLGLSHWKAGRPLDAEDALTQVLAIDPEHVKARLNLARVLLQEDRPAEALPEARRVTQLAPESGEACRVMGRAFQNLNRNEEALDAYARAVRLNPRDVWAMNNLALIHIQQERFDEALPPLARAAQIRGDVAVIQNNLGVALERTGRISAAGAAYRAAMDADPEHRRASESLARIEGIPDETGFGETHLAELAARFAERSERPAMRRRVTRRRRWRRRVPPDRHGANEAGPPDERPRFILFAGDGSRRGSVPPPPG